MVAWKTRRGKGQAEVEEGDSWLGDYRKSQKERKVGVELGKCLSE